jgi:prepilin-type N-terminal cleavage/methylation domain-containing protein
VRRGVPAGDGRGPSDPGEVGGFTLVEVMVAILVLAILGTATLSMMAGTLLHVAGAHQQETATDLAEQQMQQIRSNPRAYTSAGTASATSVDHTQYSVSWSAPTSAGANLEWYSVTISWSSDNTRGNSSKLVDEEMVCANAAC